MTSEEITAYRLRLETASAARVHEIVQEIVETDTFPGKLVAPLLKQIKAGAYIEPDILTSAIAGAQSRELYQAARERILGSKDNLIELFSKGFKDEELEAEMCKIAFAAGNKDATEYEILRGPVVRDAMVVHGGIASLQALRAILLTYEPLLQEYKTAKRGEWPTNSEWKNHPARALMKMDFDAVRWASYLEEVRKAVAATEARLAVESAK